jgi:hypothetical protein
MRPSPSHSEHSKQDDEEFVEDWTERVEEDPGTGSEYDYNSWDDAEGLWSGDRGRDPDVSKFLLLLNMYM